MEEKRLFLLDAYALIFRAYYALIRMPRITSTGFNTSAIFGFVNTLEELLTKERPTHIAVCFDPEGPTFRHKAYEEYKGERESTPEDIKKSIPIIKEIIRAYRIPIIEVEGYEADDVIGTMSKKAEKEGFTTYMMTPDKDFGQLVTDNVLQYKPSYRGQDFELRGVAEVCSRYGIERPEQVIDLLALMGDAIDNIPGAKGIGEKTATTLIQKYGDVENVIAHAADLTPANRRKIEEQAEQIRFSRFLATIKTDVEIDFKPEDLVRREVDKEKLFAIFRSLEFRTLTQRVEKRLAASEAPKKKPVQASLFDMMDDEPQLQEDTPKATLDADKMKYTEVKDTQALEALTARLLKADVCGVFLAASGESDMTAKLVGSAIATGEGEAWYIPADFAEGTAFVLDTLARSDIRKVSAQAKRQYTIAHNLRTDNSQAPLNNYYDISIAHYLLQPEMRHTTESMAETVLHYSMIDLEAIVGKKNAKEMNLAKADAAQLRVWACEQADVALRLYEPLNRKVEEENMQKLLWDMELPLVRVLAEMEIEGVRLDVEALNAAREDLMGRLAELEKDIYSLAGEEFNVGSPSKVGEILFDKLQLDPKAKKTKSGQYSTSEDVLEKVAYKNPIVGKILEYRQFKKLITTYLTALPAAINPVTGKVHTTYNQTVTATGRLSSTNPNLQNIPVRDEEGREIRKAFIADPGHLFLSADYSQIELRLVADFAKDETMLDAFRHDKDIHAITASKIYHEPLENVSSTQRRNAKTANFGILYGISAFGLSSRLGIPRTEAKDLIDGYFATFPSVHKYMHESIEKAREHGYVTTPMGRKRMLPDINSKNPVVRGYAERNAINAPIQGAAADIIKMAMVNIFNAMQQAGLKSKMIMQVHDELNFDVVPEEVPQMQELVTRLMTEAYHGDVTLTASCGVATNWLEAH